MAEIPVIKVATEDGRARAFAERSLPGINYPCEGNLCENIDILNLTANLSEISACCRRSLGLFALQRDSLGSPLQFIWNFYPCG